MWENITRSTKTVNHHMNLMRFHRFIIFLRYAIYHDGAFFTYIADMLHTSSLWRFHKNVWQHDSVYVPSICHSICTRKFFPSLSISRSRIAARFLRARHNLQHYFQFVAKNNRFHRIKKLMNRLRFKQHICVNASLQRRTGFHRNVSIYGNVVINEWGGVMMWKNSQSSSLIIKRG